MDIWTQTGSGFWSKRPELYQAGDAMEAVFTQTLTGDEKERLAGLLKRLLED